MRLIHSGLSLTAQDVDGRLLKVWVSCPRHGETTPTADTGANIADTAPGTEDEQHQC